LMLTRVFLAGLDFTMTKTHKIKIQGVVGLG